MRISDVIKQADELRDNVISEDLKASWINELEGNVAEIVGVEAPENKWPEEDSELLMPAPHDGIYTLYLTAKIDYYNQEGSLYANDMAVFNAAMSEARAWYIRNNRPKDSGRYWKVM